MHPEGFGATVEDVRAMIRSSFDPEERDLVWDALQVMEGSVPQHSLRRVQVAALMLADGDRSKLKGEIDLACLDHRDVLRGAYYPEAYDADAYVGRGRACRPDGYGNS